MPGSSMPSLLVGRPHGWSTPGDIDGQRLERFLAFGVDMHVSSAQRTLDDAASARRRWVDTHGLLDPDDDTLAQLLRTCVEMALAVARRRAPHATLTMGLSGGYDSRPLLWSLHELGERPYLYTFGQPGNIDFDLIDVIDEQLDLGVEMIDSNSLTWSLDDFDAEAAVTSDLPLSPRVAAGRRIDDTVGARIEVHGFLNGARSGASTAVELLAPEQQVDAFLAANNPFGFQAMLGPEHVRALLPMHVVDEQRGLSTYRQLDLAFRQWQRIKLPSRPGREYAYPYAESAWQGFWLTRPPEQLEGQSRWLRFVRSVPPRYFPDLAGIEGHRSVTRRARLERLYSGSHAWRAVPPGISAPRNPTHHFCLRATAQNNSSFSAMLTESLRRLRGRQVVDAALIDRVEQRFAADDATAARMMNGLVTLDTCLESGRFSRDHDSTTHSRGGA